MSGSALFLAVFLGCVVEAVEALTIVLAAGTARDWRSAMLGVAGGVLILASAVAVLGSAVSSIPLGGLRLFVGGLLLVFGLQWLRKAILRASGLKALHDEAGIYRRELMSAEAAAAQRRAFVPDWYAFTLSFEGVVLEGLEVVFIAVTFGSNQHNVALAAAAAGAAVLLVAVAGVAVRAPLSRVPENTLKFVVGMTLTAFGTFWGAEGAGARWPGADAALVVLIPATGVFALALVAFFGGPPGHQRTSDGRISRAGPKKRIRAFGAFWYDFIVGDDWQVAAGVALALCMTFLLAPRTTVPVWWLVPVAVVLLLPASLHRAARRAR